jgi:GT2 family glycosyltransferase
MSRTLTAPETALFPAPFTIAAQTPDSFNGSSEKITVLIPNWNGLRWLNDCLGSLFEQDIQNFHTIVVDNGSTDSSVDFIKEHYPRVEIVALANNAGFAGAMNVGIEKSVSPYIVLLNSDTRPYPDWLSKLLEQIENSPREVAAINSQLLRMDDPELIDDAGDELSWYGAAIKQGHNRPAVSYQEVKEVFSPCAAACLYRREFLLKTGGFDAAFFAYLEDVDLGLRGRLLGYRYLYLPGARVLHKGHGASLTHARYVELITRNRLLLFAKNIPARLLLRHAARLLYGQIYFMGAYACPWSSMKGYLSFLAELPVVLRKRRQMLNNTALTINQIDALLHKRLPHPSLYGLIRQYTSEFVGR